MSYELWEVVVATSIFAGLALIHLVAGGSWKIDGNRDIVRVSKSESPSDYIFAVSLASVLALAGTVLIVLKLVTA